MAGMERFLSKNRKAEAKADAPAPACPSTTEPVPAVAEPSPEAKAAKKAAKKAANAALPQVRHKCGHLTALRWLEQQDCPECRNKARQQKAAQRREKQQAKAQVIPADSGRLPHGAIYHKEYDSVSMTWTATLSIPSLGLEFKAVASGSFRAEKDCDSLYREWVANLVEQNRPEEKQS